jgi:hypothetical protein
VEEIEKAGWLGYPPKKGDSLLLSSRKSQRGKVISYSFSKTNTDHPQAFSG